MPCAYNSDCQSGLRCVLSVCRDECRADIDCPEGRQCVAVSGDGVRACLQRQDAGSDVPVDNETHTDDARSDGAIDSPDDAQLTDGAPDVADAAGTHDAVDVRDASSDACPLPALPVRCGTACVDTTRDRANCGACGTACPAPRTCAAGMCVAIVATGIEAAARHTCAVLNDGTVRCWGMNNRGQLGDGTRTPRWMPLAVMGVTDAVAVYAGTEHSCARLRDDSVRCWGRNDAGQLGDGTTVDALAPVTVPMLPNVQRVSLGHSHSCAWTVGMAVYGWGSNSQGVLGFDPVALPVVNPARLLAGLPTGDIVDIACAAPLTCVIVGDRSVRCVGTNYLGAVLGRTPVVIGGLSEIARIALGEFHGCGISATNAVRCWGGNSFGQLGRGATSAGEMVPVDVVGLTATRVAVAPTHTCAVHTDGSARCWGRNSVGQLGVPVSAMSVSPVAVVGLPSGVAEIVVGDSHTCALLGTGAVFCWGRNADGELGIDMALVSALTATPTRVTF